MAAWGLPELLLRRQEYWLAALVWQNTGKGQKPKMIPLPDDAKKPSARKVPDVVRRMREAGLIPLEDARNPPADLPGVVTVVD